jgi:hypothetical protein
MLGLALLTIGAGTGYAQGGIDFYFGMGTIRDAAAEPINLGDGTFQERPAMGGVFGTVGGDVMVTPKLGVGVEVAFRFAQADYASGYNYRPVFYDFNGIWAPVTGKHLFVPEFQGGLGGASLRFYGGTPYYDYNTGQYTNFAGSSNHLQLHAGAGLRIYFSDRAFLRPQVDLHWVRNLNQEFKSNTAMAYSIAIGYSLTQ